MKKILFCSKYGLDLKNSAGGQHLRIKTSVEALSKISDLIIVSRNVRYEKCKKLGFLKNKNFLFAPSVKEIIPKNIMRPIFWRIKETFYIKKDAEYLVKLYEQNNCSCIWISYSSQSLNLIRKIKEINPKIKIVSDTDSVFYKFLQRKMKHVNFFKKFFLYINFNIYKNIEKKMLNISDIVTTVSEYDRKIFKKINHKSKIMIFRNAVEDIKLKRTKHKNFNIILSGTFGNKNSPMNVSTRWFINRIYPRIKKEIYNLKVYIIGMNSTKEFKSVDKIIVKDWVLNIKKFFSLCDLAAVPLQYESGTRFKILEAGIYGLPVVSTTLGAEGLKYVDNKTILIADDPKKFAEKIIHLFNNPHQRKKISKNNMRLVKETYSLKNISNDGLKILKELN